MDSNDGIPIVLESTDNASILESTEGTSITSGNTSNKTEVQGCWPRIRNILKNNYRGLIGVAVPLFGLTWQLRKFHYDITVWCMWLWMIWFFLVQPVNIPVTGLIPLFVLPMCGVMSTADTCKCYMNEGIVMYILGSMLILLLNNSGIDRRIALWLICSGDSCQFSGKRLVFKCSTAAFFLSMFSSRLIVTSAMTQYMAPALQSMQSGTTRAAEPDFDTIRHIVCSSIHTSASIGSIAIIHASFATLTFRTIFYEFARGLTIWPDIFNYLQYTLYAFPVAFLMFVLNFAYHMILINSQTDKPMSPAAMSTLRNSLLMYKKDMPRRTTLHEKLTVLCSLVMLIVFFTRWNRFMDGWATFRMDPSSPGPIVKDATVAALFVIALHTLPKGFSFLKYLTAEKKSELGPIKPESAILWWRFVDKNMNYGYLFLLGSGVALSVAFINTGLDRYLTHVLGFRLFTRYNWYLSLFLVCLVAVALANVMSPCAACVSFLPMVLNMNKFFKARVASRAELRDGELIPRFGWVKNSHWVTHVYLGALAVGVACNLSFMCPFLYSPAYFCYHTGKVPKKIMAMYGVGSLIICLAVLYVSLLLWAPYLWDPLGAGFFTYPPPDVAYLTTTTSSTIPSDISS